MLKKYLSGITCFLFSILLFKESYSQVPRDPLSAYSGTIKKNYVRVWDATGPENNPMTLMTKQLRDVKQATQYFDGLSRPLQAVIKQGSYSNGVTSDLVTANEYNVYGIEEYKYIPVAMVRVSTHLFMISYHCVLKNNYFSNLLFHIKNHH